MTYTPRFEVSEKVDYGYVINRQLDRIAEIRSKIFKSFEGDIFDNTAFNRALDYISHLESLHALLLPELKGNVGGMLRDVEALIDNIWLYEVCKRKKGKEECKELHNKIRELLRNLRVKYELQNDEVRTSDWFYVVFAICDKALEMMITNLNSVGLLLRGKPVKLGVVEKK